MSVAPRPHWKCLSADEISARERKKTSRKVGKKRERRADGNTDVVVRARMARPTGLSPKEKPLDMAKRKKKAKKATKTAKKAKRKGRRKA